MTHENTRTRDRLVLLLTRALVVMLLAVSACTNATPEKQEADIVADSFPEAQAEIRAQMAALEDIVNRRDCAALRSVHLESTKFSKFGRAGERQVFEEMIGDEIGRASVISNLSIDQRDLRIDVFGQVAVATALPVFTMTDAAGDTIKVEFRGTLVWVKTIDGWKIAHEHNSSPYTP